MTPSFAIISAAAPVSESFAIAGSDTWRMRVASNGHRKTSAMNSAQPAAIELSMKRLSHAPWSP